MKNPSATELQIHCAIVDLLRIDASPALIWFHPANGEERVPAIAAKLYRMGVVPGVADIAFTLPDGRSAYLEVKSDAGVQSPPQKAFQARCEEIGTPYAIVRSLDEAMGILGAWGALRITRARAA